MYMTYPAPDGDQGTNLVKQRTFSQGLRETYA